MELEGIAYIANDILVYGCGATINEVQHETLSKSPVTAGQMPPARDQNESYENAIE